MIGFDLKAFEGAHHSGTLKNGEYLACVDKMEWSVSESGDNMLVATIFIHSGNGGKKMVKDYFNLFNKNSTASEIAATRLVDLIGACGLRETPSDARVFEGMTFWVKVGTDRNGYNSIERYIYWKPVNNDEVLKANLAKFSVEAISSVSESQIGSDYLDDYTSSGVTGDDSEFFEIEEME